MYNSVIMPTAARAIIIENNKILVMLRNKEGSQYYTLVGGRISEDETIEDGLKREVKEETGMDISNTRLIYTETHAAPYNDQYIFLCEVAPHDLIALQDTSEEAFMNRLNVNTHQPVWTDISNFERLAFRTPQLQTAIVKAFRKGFPENPIAL